MITVPFGRVSEPSIVNYWPAQSKEFAAMTIILCLA